MIDPSILRELVDAVEVPEPYRNRVGSYGPDVARSLLSLYDSLKEILNSGADDRPSQVG